MNIEENRTGYAHNSVHLGFLSLVNK